jgi:hypothetical protein
MDLVVVTDATRRLVDIRQGALLVRIEIVDKSHPRTEYESQTHPLGTEYESQTHQSADE